MKNAAYYKQEYYCVYKNACFYKWYCVEILEKPEYYDGGLCQNNGDIHSK